jgi:DNA polymerase V
MREAVAVYTTRAAERMRKHKMAAGVVTVFINTNRFSEEPQYNNSATFELAHPTDATGAPSNAGRAAALWRPRPGTPPSRSSGGSSCRST